MKYTLEVRVTTTFEYFFGGKGGKARAGIFLILRKSFLSIKSHWNQYSINEVNTCRIYPLNDTFQKVRASSCMLFIKLNFYLLKGEPGLPGARGLPVSNTFGIWSGFFRTSVSIWRILTIMCSEEKPETISEVLKSS